MNRIKLFAVLFACAIIPYTGFAQNQKTTIKVVLTVEKEVVKKGPYAAFSQQLLGVIAPLNDKVNYSIKKAELFAIQESTGINNSDQADCKSMADYTSDIAHKKPNLQIDKVESIQRGNAQAATEAADMIFNLRKRRIDLITGETGENVFGAGLTSALQEINRLEQEYTELFMGTTTTQTIQKTFDIIPESGKTSSIVCRFSDTEGFYSKNMDGRLISMNFINEQKDETIGRQKGTAKKNIVTYVVPSMVLCNLYDGQNIIESQSFLIYQFGKTIEVEAPKSK